jgi:hypothetical protein
VALRFREKSKQYAVTIALLFKNFRVPPISLNDNYSPENAKNIAQQPVIMRREPGKHEPIMDKTGEKLWNQALPLWQNGERVLVTV